MASLSAPALGATSIVNLPACCSSAKSEIVGSALPPLPQLGSFRSSRTLKVEAKGGYGKISTKTPYGPGGGAKFKGGLDASGRKAKGKGVYQFTKKYGANVDGYSPIYAPDEWARSGEVYAAGPNGLALWALTLGGILFAGALLVYNTSALAQ